MGTRPSAQDLHGARAVNRNSSLLGNCDFAAFPRFEGFRETVHFAGNRSFGAIGARAKNTRISNGFCMFAEGIAAAPGEPGNRLI